MDRPILHPLFGKQRKWREAVRIYQKGKPNFLKKKIPKNFQQNFKKNFKIKDELWNFS